MRQSTNLRTKFDQLWPHRTKRDSGAILTTKLSACIIYGFPEKTHEDPPAHSGVTSGATSIPEKVP